MRSIDASGALSSADCISSTFTRASSRNSRFRSFSSVSTIVRALPCTRYAAHLSYDLDGMSMETLAVARAAFDAEDPWSTPAECAPVRLRRSTDGTAPRLATSVALWYDDEFLSVLF